MYVLCSLGPVIDWSLHFTVTEPSFMLRKNIQQIALHNQTVQAEIGRVEWGSPQNLFLGMYHYSLDFRGSRKVCQQQKY